LGATGTRSEYHSSEAVTRVFCGRCGSPLLWLHRDAPERVALALSSLDRDPGTRTNLKLHFEDQAAWLFCPFEDSETPSSA
ncbi:MAG: GFA family protein, partial [Acidobacteria bacterium]|nr:GFA family protein [Acidobacteriota bacterium]